MADTDLKPMTDGDIETPPADAQFEPAAPLKTAGVEFEAEIVTDRPADSVAGEAKGALKDGATKLTGEAGDRIRTLADTGKDKASTTLDQFSALLSDAAGQVDERLGAQYGDYARNAATSVQGFADSLRNKDVDQLADEARALVRKSPAVAVGIAAALGFVVARLIQSGVDANRA